MAEQLLSTDPRAGQLLSTDPGAGATDAHGVPLDAPRDARGQIVTSHEEDPSTLDRLNEMLGPLAHPQTFTDFARLLTLPVDTVKRAYASAIAMAAARPVAGAAISATGRGLETMGTEAADSTRQLGALDLLTSHKPVRAAAIAVAPTVMKATGRGLQRVGAVVTPAIAKAAPAVAEVESAAAPIATSAAQLDEEARLFQELRDTIAKRQAAAPAAAMEESSPFAKPVSDVADMPGPRAVKNALPDQKALNEAALAARRAAYQASLEPAADTVVKASGKMHFTAPEWAAFRELRARGVNLEDAAAGAKAAGQLARQFGLSQPTAAQTSFPKGNRR